MPRSAGMNLVFRLGDFAFSLSVDDLIEICEEPAGSLAEDKNGLFAHCLGMLAYRGRNIPVIDLQSLFRISPAISVAASKLLIVAGESGLWGVPVSRIEGIFPASAFSLCRAPLLAMLPGPRPYTSVELWHDELLVRCDAFWLERFWCQP